MKTKKSAQPKRVKPIKVTVRVLKESALKAFETNCHITTVTNFAK